MLDTLQNGKKVTPDEEPTQHEDIIQKCIGVLGRWHIWLCFVIFLVKFGVAWHQLSIVFLAPPIKYYCADNITEACTANCSSYVYDTSVFTSTITTEWDLVCSKSHLMTLTQTLTMFGILVGSMLFGYLSDRFGRKLPLVLAVAVQGFSGLGAAFSPWFVLFLFMKFVSAVATGGTMITSFVLIMEVIGVEWRTILGILYQIPFNIGHLLMPLFSYLHRDWRYFQIIISAPSLLLISYYWLLPESPRWQLVVGKQKLAIKTLKRAAKCNNLPTDKIEQDVYDYLEQKHVNHKVIHKGNIFDLVRTPIMRTYTIALGFNWLVCGLCFFGFSQFIGQLGGNIFINVAISAVIQIPSTLFACYSTKVWGRKKTLIGANIVSGISIIIMDFVPTNPAWIRTILSTIGMFGFALSFPTVYIYSGELYPTVVRNVGVGTSSMCARIGSMIAPLVATLGATNPWIPTVIFGLTPLIGAALCLKLPETLDCELPDTIEEAEAFQITKKKSIC